MSWQERVKELFSSDMSINQTAYAIQAEYFPDVKFDTVRDRVRNIKRRGPDYKKDIPKLDYGGNNKYSYSFDKINLYPLGDLHIGAYGFAEKKLKAYIRQIEQDEYGKVILLGDLLDNATIGSKGNVYSQRMTPQKQKETAIELLYPIRDKILYVCSGNHCQRTYEKTGSDIMKDICMGLGTVDRYHPVAGYIKIKAGKQTYNIYATHNLGKGEAKLTAIAKSFIGIDLLLGGHIHTPKNITVPQKEYGGAQIDTKVVIVSSWLIDENYAVSAAYEPVSMQQYVIELEGDRHWVKVMI